MSLEDLLSYELAPVPFSLFSNYGSTRKSSKAVLMKKLGVFKQDEPKVDCFIIKGNEMLYHVAWPKANNVRQLSVSFSKDVVRDGNEVHVVFDKYNTSSIKVHERNRRVSNKVYPNHNLKLDIDLPSRGKIMKNIHNKQQVI